MNKTVPRTKKSLTRLKRLAALGLLLMTMTAGASYASENTPESRKEASRKDTILSIRMNRTSGNKKYKIRLYPDAKKQVLFFSANGGTQNIYQLYMFDMDGKLVNQTSIRNHETTVLTNLSEGNYLIEVFSNDQRIVNGQMTVN
ncbi:MAG: T9SS type A sorting domain-containing protein [Puia sp.]|nr:T9SS type A sorting domain-containing protein [Puia sp.]